MFRHTHRLPSLARLRVCLNTEYCSASSGCNNYLMQQNKASPDPQQLVPSRPHAQNAKSIKSLLRLTTPPSSCSSIKFCKKLSTWLALLREGAERGIFIMEFATSCGTSTALPLLPVSTWQGGSKAAKHMLVSINPKNVIGLVSRKARVNQPAHKFRAAEGVCVLAVILNAKAPTTQSVMACPSACMRVRPV